MAQSWPMPSTRTWAVTEVVVEKTVHPAGNLRVGGNVKPGILSMNPSV